MILVNKHKSITRDPALKSQDFHEIATQFLKTYIYFLKFLCREKFQVSK